MLSRAVARILVASMMLLGPASAAADTGIVQKSYLPVQDTYVEYYDLAVHGFEPTIRVGIEPRECFSNGWNPCDDDGKECCDVLETYNYCAVPGQCATTTPSWTDHRKMYAYIRFDLTEVPDGKVVSATLRLQEVGKVEQMGGPVKVIVTELKKIGIPNETCEWNEATLNDVNGTTWNSLPQNLSTTPEGVWAFDVTKAVLDWLEGNPDQLGNPIQPNCGFYLYDPDYGNAASPIARWVLFSSKEGGFPPQLLITFAQDLDGDGYFGDCNEEDPAIHPGAIETCDGVDQDCDGLADEEDCDGKDNDCDGQVDEEELPEGLCGDGMLCLGGTCVVTCYDECSGPYDKKCEKDEVGTWSGWFCKNVDADPCLDWYQWETCDAPNVNCQFGSCSSNCIDLCEPEQAGTTFCYEDSLGHWSLSGCDDYDGDGCLEPGAFQPCPAGAFCYEAKCWPGCEEKCEILAGGGCLDACVPGEGRCRKLPDGLYHLEQCLKAQGQTCYGWSDVGACSDPLLPYCKPVDDQTPAPQEFCKAKVYCDEWWMCAPEYLGLKTCLTDSVGNRFIGECGDQDGDGCLQWESVETCEAGGGCVDGECTPGCAFRCHEPLAAECVGEAAVKGCVDADQDGCFEWVELKQCDPAAEACKDALCQPTVPVCQDECDEGESTCIVAEDGIGYLFPCVPDEDADPCLEWGNSVATACASGCSPQGDACAQPPPEEACECLVEPLPEPIPEVVEEAPDVVADAGPDVAEPAPDLPSPDTAADTGAEPGPEVAADVAADQASADATAQPDESDAGGGCSCRVAPVRSPPGPGPLLLLLAAALLLARLRRARQA